MAKAVSVIGLVLLTCALLTEQAHAQNGGDVFAQGKAALAKGDLDGALSSFAAAARADRNNQQYMQQYMFARRMVELRNSLKTERDAARWEYSARALRSFYLGEGLHGEAMAVDRQLHERLKTSETAMMLAETQLALKKNADAYSTLVALPAADQTLPVEALKGIALAREGKQAEAKKIAAAVSAADKSDPGMAYLAARLAAATGDSAKAVAFLIACLEQIPPSRSDAVKTHAQACPEFTAIAKAADFQQALQTKSKVAESKCSGGSSCASCPMRGGCPKSQGKQ